MSIFHSYVKLPEGIFNLNSNIHDIQMYPDVSRWDNLGICSKTAWYNRTTDVTNTEVIHEQPIDILQLIQFIDRLVLAPNGKKSSFLSSFRMILMILMEYLYIVYETFDDLYSHY